MNQFKALAEADNLVGLPALYRPDVPWLLTLDKEDNAMRVILHEKTPSGEFVALPGDDGPPCFLLYGPRASFKMRCESVNDANRFLTMFYNGMPKVSEILHTKEWAMIASIDDGGISNKHRVILDSNPPKNPAAWNKEIFDAFLATQPYDKGLSRFTTMFKPDVGLSAITAIEPGCHHDHGCAIYFQQDTRRCLIMDTLFGLSDDEALWYTLQAWAKFQPRLARPRSEPGKLYFPSAYTHVFTKYWDYLNAPLLHPDCCETDFTKAAMREMTSALGETDLSAFIPEPDVEADDKSCCIAQTAALSRRCPIQDAADYWSPPQDNGRSSQATVQGGSAPGQDVHNVDT
jgi:hypothetical protein